ncbi:GreA/GreB family elongation factor [Actinosynnema sp. NPDC050436]|uniref:GreA/GreB family elongation factor n=1 Tax=Actinosynnema sp. NPDC050436 TaxID=3155659 RepID=UPI0033DF31E7
MTDWLTPEAHARLRAELAALLALPAPRADDDLVTTTRRQREVRIREVRDLLARAVVGEDPPDDGVAEPGMVLTVRYDDTGEVETFLLGVRDTEAGPADREGAGLEVYSPGSPLGTALDGARRGERRSYQVPSGAVVRVTLVDAVPYSRRLTTGGPSAG